LIEAAGEYPSRGGGYINSPPSEGWQAQPDGVVLIWKTLWVFKRPPRPGGHPSRGGGLIEAAGEYPSRGGEL